MNQPKLFSDSECAPYKEPVLVSMCFLGIPCRWHGRRARIREKLIQELKKKYVLVPVCPEQIGGMPTPRTGEYINGTGAQVLDEGLRIIVPETGEDTTNYHINGAKYILELAQIVGAKRAYLKSGSPSCDREGVTGEMLSRAGHKSNPSRLSLSDVKPICCLIPGFFILRYNVLTPTFNIPASKKGN